MGCVQVPELNRAIREASLEQTALRGQCLNGVSKLVGLIIRGKFTPELEYWEKNALVLAYSYSSGT